MQAVKKNHLNIADDFNYIPLRDLQILFFCFFALMFLCVGVKVFKCRNLFLSVYIVLEGRAAYLFFSVNDSLSAPSD